MSPDISRFLFLSFGNVGDDFISFLDQHVLGINKNIVVSSRVVHIEENHGSSFFVTVEILSRLLLAKDVEFIEEGYHLFLSGFFYFLHV